MTSQPCPEHGHQVKIIFPSTFAIGMAKVTKFLSRAVVGSFIIS